MKRFFLPLLALAMVFSCNNEQTKDTVTEIKDAPVKAVTRLLGSFFGDFGDNKITVLITKADNGIVEGRSIVGGNDRPFTGSFVEKDGVYSITAKEPGDDAHDGVFDFTLTAAADELKGSWKPYDTKITPKDYVLKRKAFTYRTDVGDFPEASQRELKPEDVENMMKMDLEWMRNEIFARHGYCFKKKDMRDAFEEREWYIPDNTDVKDKLTDIEKKNLALIKRYEKYAEDYGDEYGR